MAKIIRNIQELRDLFKEVSKMEIPKQGFEITVRDYAEVQTHDQRKFLESVISDAASAGGLSSSGEKKSFREEVFKKCSAIQYVEMSGSGGRKVRTSTAEMTREEMTNLIEQVILTLTTDYDYTPREIY